MFFSFDYVIKEMVNAAAVQPPASISRCAFTISLIKILSRLNKSGWFCEVEMTASLYSLEIGIFKNSFQAGEIEKPQGAHTNCVIICVFKI